eukprot:TRINITY_DN5471_c0_g3_i1.p1 TRINITY_DN5471_c0_g3~~TRINITY_DN5471_c0_g3_i1.p1  ORF type:complete len:103 (-),score=15.04 TRINITY_DN5471_c0_g3_i1:49-357(-)
MIFLTENSIVPQMTDSVIATERATRTANRAAFMLPAPKSLETLVLHWLMLINMVVESERNHHLKMLIPPKRLLHFCLQYVSFMENFKQKLNVNGYLVAAISP